MAYGILSKSKTNSLKYRFSKNGFLANNAYLLIAAAWAITISFIIDNYWSGTSTNESVKKTIERGIQNKQKDFDKFCKDSSLVKRLANNKYGEYTLREMEEKEYFIFIYKNNKCVFWNTQIVQPDSANTNSPSSSYMAKLANGWYVTDKKYFKGSGDNQFTIISLIPVKWQYYITNRYLKNSFSNIDNIENDFKISLQPAELEIKGLAGNTLFYLHLENNVKIAQSNMLAILLKIIAALLVLIFINLAANYIVLKNGLLRGFMALFIPVTFLRILSYFIPIPLNFRQLELFDPGIYGSNFILRSLGDLLINSLLFVWFILFVRYHLQKISFRLNTVSTLKRAAIVLGIAVMMITVTFLCGHVIRRLVADSQISFDVINFFTLSIYSVIGFIILCCIATSYFFLFQILFYILNPFIKKGSFILYIALSVSGLIILSLKLASPFVGFDLLLLLWLLLFTFIINRNYERLIASGIISSLYLFWVFFFSVSMTAIIVSENKEKELDLRKHFAENISNKSDSLSERMINIAVSDLKNDFLSGIFYRFYDRNDNNNIKDSLINLNFSRYLNNYDTRIYTFDANENPLYNADSTAFNTLNTIIETQGKSASTSGLYYYDVSYEIFNYIVRKRVTDDAGIIKGFVFILSNPKRNKSDTFSPELFSRGSNNSIENSSLYAFAVYNKNILISSHNNYQFPTKIPATKHPNNEFWTKKRNGNDELWYKADGDKVIVITRPESFFIESITLFAYLFCSFLFLTALLRALTFLVHTKFNLSKIKILSGLNIRTQIHGTIILISIFSFLIIGITTILFFNNKYHNNNSENISKTIQVMQDDVRKYLDTNDSSMAELQSKSNKYIDDVGLTNTITKIAEIYSVDINLYDLNGNLRLSSLPLPYAKGIVSNKMDPMAYYHLKKLNDVQFFRDQKIGSLNYQSNYVPVRNEKGAEYAYLNIPYFESESKLEEEISNFLVTLINLNAFIFLIAGIIALFITNRVTQSFSLISNKMKEVNLGKVNEMISWDRKDEIGELVKEYNKMVKKLDASAEMLARSEREGAWREMARQVAHEIKNPLTPMKLNLQYLQKAIDSNAPNIKEIFVYVTKVVVEQIDHLSQIAGDFAQFANIGQSKNLHFNLIDSLKQITSLYSLNDKLQIIMYADTNNIMIKADRTQINRLFTNLLQNAIQSVPDERNAEIKITTTVNGENVLVAVKDNGKGIPTDMMGKIFTPNFTTKSSGTGLGLAMCKVIVEKANGIIWFETVDGESTTFFVQLPLADVGDKI